MTAAQGNFQTALDQVNTAYNNMTQQQENLIQNWQGDAAQAFVGAVDKWLEDFGVVRSQLVKMVETLSSNTGVYSNTTEGSQQMASAFANGLTSVPPLPF
jgi:WXG100 family type VII secretion target